VISRVNNLFHLCYFFLFLVLVFRPNGWQSPSSGYGISLHVNQPETGALKLPYQLNNYNVIAIFSSAGWLLK